MSFPSGHSSFSFAMANYTALAIGGRFVWGDKRTPISAPLGAAAQIGLLGLAAWVGVSRVDDGRHNPSDVLAGMAVGLLWSNVAYWRRFDAHGRSRRAFSPKIDLTPGPGDVGAALRMRF
jgi:membrane-associated phospholipid phosphatase